MHLAELAVWHVLQLVKILIGRGDLNPAAPAAGTVEIQTVGIRYLRAVDVDGVIVKPLVLRARHPGPDAVFTLGQCGCTDTHALGLRRSDTVAHTMLGIDLWKLLPVLVGGRGLEVLYRRRQRSRSGSWRGLGESRLQ